MGTQMSEFQTKAARKLALLEADGPQREQCMGMDVGWGRAAAPRWSKDPQKPAIAEKQEPHLPKMYLSKNGWSGEYATENWIFRKSPRPEGGLGAPSNQEEGQMEEEGTIGASRNATQNASRRPKDPPCTDGRQEEVHASSGHGTGPNLAES